MAQLTIGDLTSQVKNLLKANKQAAFLTDKEIYLLFKKHSAVIMKRLDEKGKLTKFSSVFETLDFVELVEVDKAEASECGIVPQSYSTFRKTKLQMPMFTEGVYGPMVNSVTSVDGSTVYKMVRNIDIYNMAMKSSDSKYNKWKYCWFINDRLYFPNTNAPAVRIEGLFEDDISAFKCCYEDRCKRRQDQSLNVPDYLLAEAIGNLLKEMGIQMQPGLSDNQNNNQSPLK